MILNQKSALPRNAQRKKGFTLTEIAIVLGIIGLILGAIWAAASSVYANLKANQAQQGILAAAQAVRSMFATSANTGSTGLITTPGMFPTNWSSTTAGVTGNPWHVNPTASYAYVIGSNNQFAVEIDGISDTGCAQLLSFYNSQASSANGGSVPGLTGTSYLAATNTVNGSNTTSQMGASATAVGTAIAATYAAPTSCKAGNLLDNIAITFNMSIM